MLAVSMLDNARRNEDLVEVIEKEVEVRMKQNKIKVIDMVTLVKAYIKMGR
jgi:hypothetical protein